jgi:predicted DNA-binding antitoxin AbrB/MazE fold protein
LEEVAVTKMQEMKVVEAVFEQGSLRPLERLPLVERQHVWLTILLDEPTAQQLAQLATQSPSFQFLGDPVENLYSREDGQPV